MSARQPPTSQTVSSHQERNELAVERYARGDAHDEQHQHQAVVGRGLDEGERTREHRDEQDKVQQPLRQCRGGGVTLLGGKARRCGAADAQ
jgi:hypothetical protein